MAASDTENYLTNPVNVYRLMKRLHTDWSLMEGRMQLMAEEMSKCTHHIQGLLLLTLTFSPRFPRYQGVRPELPQPGGRGGGCSGSRPPAEHLQTGRGPGGPGHSEWRQIRVRPQSGLGGGSG